MNDTAIPLSPGPLLRRLARAVLALVGWRIAFPWPPPPKAVIIVYPHTSNWDFVIGILARFAVGLPITWVAKDTLFRWPFGALFRAMGGIPVNRREHTGATGALVAEFARRPFLWLAIAPEGTRSYTDRLRSGFYHLALGARVPVGLGFIDYRRREVGVTEWVTLTGDAERDLAQLRRFYAGKAPLRPAQAGEIRFLDAPP